MCFETISWTSDNKLKILDQTKLPKELNYIICQTKEEVFEAIKKLQVRGAPAIGISASYGMVLDLLNLDIKDVNLLKKRFQNTASFLKKSRPTAVNLFWAIDSMIKISEEFIGDDYNNFINIVLSKAKEIHDEDRKLCDNIGEFGEKLISDNMSILTHCNAGALATGGIGTALSVFYKAKNKNKTFKVYADETRPLLQGARLTAFELKKANIDVTLICDSMAGFLMKQGKIDMVITGADRIAKNGDTANKIGTFSVAKLANIFNIPFYIAAPYSTFDMSSETGDDIVIEQRNSNEIKFIKNTQIAPDDVHVYNPAFDITEGELIKGFITDKGIIYSNDGKYDFK